MFFTLAKIIGVLDVCLLIKFNIDRNSPNLCVTVCMPLTSSFEFFVFTLNICSLIVLNIESNFNHKALLSSLKYKSR